MSSEIFRQGALLVRQDVPGVIGLEVGGSGVLLREPEVAELEAALKAWRRSVRETSLFARGGPWGVVSVGKPLAEVRRSSDLRVTRVWDGESGVTVIHVGNGVHCLTAAHVLVGGPWTYRDEARRAKAAYIIEKKIRKTTAAEVWGYDGESHGF